MKQAIHERTPGFGLLRRIMLASITLAAASLLAAPMPQYHLPLDGDATWCGRDAARAKPAIVHGAAKWVDGVSGRGLDVSRWAYDQVTALVADGLPNVSTRHGTFAFWFKPHWDPGDGEKHILLRGFSRARRPFVFYLYKLPGGKLELSVVEAKQVQFLQRDFLKKESWTHIAFTWDAASNTVRLYRDGKLVKAMTDSAAFDIPDDTADIIMQFGDGTDRFKANVGDGIYDDVRLYDSALSEADIFLLAAGVSSAPMRPIAPPTCRAIRLSHDKGFLSAAEALLRFRSAGGAAFTLSASGPSRGLSLVGTTDGTSAIVSSADTLDLRAGYDLAFVPDGKTLVFSLDDAVQGRVALDRDVGAIVSAEAAEGVAVGPPCKRSGDGFAPASRVEAPLWSLDDAARRTQGVRKAVSLNGYWRVWLVDDYLGTPPDEAPGYMRVPGSFRSPLWNIHRVDPRTGALDAGTWKWHDRQLHDYRAAWYEREVAMPREWANDKGRVWLVFDHFNANVGRVYWNGELLSAFRQDFKSSSMIPHRMRIDVTDRLAAGSPNTLRLYVDRHNSGMWNGRPSLNDHNDICLGDVWLERTPGQLHVLSSVAFSKWRGDKSVSMRVRIANPGGERGEVAMRAEFARPEGGKTFERAVLLTGEPEQVVSWTEPWPDPVPWTAENPQTYELSVSLLRGGQTADTFPIQLFGFREAWVENGELWLNGEHLRLRMWSSPSLERLRYWWGHPEAIGQYVAHVKELNYNTVRDNPWRQGCIVGVFEFLDASDRQGLYNLHQMPTYEDEPRGIYDAEVERFLEAYGGHPSILMWYTDFNTCWYAWNQDPAKLSDDVSVPLELKWQRGARRRAHVAESVMRALDPAREVFQHAGGNSGKIYGSMNYQSYGTPLQEQEDWPAQWAKSHRQPLMSVESAFPYPRQFGRFDKGGLDEHLGAEHAARYFGPSAFAAERFPVPHSADLVWGMDVATGADPNMLRLSDLHYRRVVRAWRGYGVSAIGDFPGSRDHFYTIQMFDGHRVVWRVGGDPKTSGLKPENGDGFSAVQRHLLGDYSRPDYLHATVKECFAPLLVFAAGDPDDFTNKDHSFYAGERFRKSLVVVNDHLYPVTVAYRWKCGDATGSGKVSIPAGGIVREPIALEASEVAVKTDAELQIEWRGHGAAGVLAEGRDSLALRFFPRRPSPSASRPSVTLFDPLGKTAGLLRRAGVEFKAVDSLDGLQPTRLLVVGQGAFAAAPLAGNLPASVANALVFEQPTNALRRFVMTAPSCRDAFAVLPRSPCLAGLDDRDLADWRGASDTVPAFVLSAESTPHYPRSKWKCGNGGIVAGCVIRRPSRGNFRTVVSCGFNLESAALLEERRPGGRTLWCQMDVTSRYGIDPAATRLVDNLLAEVCASRADMAAMQPVYYLGSDRDAVTLASVGADIQPWDGKACGTVLVLPGADLLRLPFRYAREKTFDFRAAVPDDPAFAGVSPADLYFRNANDLPSPAFDVRHSGGTAFVFLGLAPDGSVEGLWNDEKLMRVWSIVLTNLGVALAPSSPYVPDLDAYDGDAFHNW